MGVRPEEAEAGGIAAVPATSASSRRLSWFRAGAWLSGALRVCIGWRVRRVGGVAGDAEPACPGEARGRAGMVDGEVGDAADGRAKRLEGEPEGTF